jgi:hypothetical protein
MTGYSSACYIAASITFTKETKMTISFYNASVKPMKRAVANLREVMKIGAKFASDSGISETDMLSKKLAEDMFNLGMQMNLLKVLGSDQGLLLVTGVKPSPAPAGAANFADVDAMLAAVLTDLDQIDEDAFNAAVASNKKMVCTLPPGCAHFEDCWSFVQEWALPHMYFHVTTAYCILRNNGVPLTKGNFLGALEMQMVPHAK